MKKFLATFLITAAVFSNTLAVGKTIHITADNGGDIQDYIAAVQEANNNNDTVEIKGFCYSACAIWLSAKNVVVSKKADFAAHEPHDSADYSKGYATEDARRLADLALPGCVFHLFWASGALGSENEKHFTGQQILNECPDFKAEE